MAFHGKNILLFHFQADFHRSLNPACADHIPTGHPRLGRSFREFHREEADALDPRQSVVAPALQSWRRK